MVFRPGSGSECTMPGAAAKMACDSVCLLCGAVLKKSVPGNIAVFQQQLSFTERQAIDLLVEVLNTKESALSRSRWMCAHCYAQLELLDKYERDRRLLEQKASAIQAELVATFRHAAAASRPHDRRRRRRRRGRQQGGGVDDDEEDEEAADRPDGELKNGNESETESDYVEINVASLAAAAAAAPFRSGSENGDAAPEEEEEEAAAAAGPAGELDPLADHTVDVKQEPAGSDASDVDLGEDVPAKDPLADGAEHEGSHTTDSNRGSDTPVVNVAALQNTLRTRLRSRLRSAGGPSTPPPPPLRMMGKRPLSPAAAAAGDDGDSPPAAAAPPIHVSVCVVQPRAAGPKTLLPKPGLGQSPLPASPVTAPPPLPPPAAAPVPASSPTVSATPAVAVSTAGGAQLPVLLQGTDGKLYVLPTGSQPAVTAAISPAASPVTLLRLPDGRLVMSGSQTAPPPPPSPILPPVTPPAASASTLKNLLLGGGGGAGQRPSSAGAAQKQLAGGRSVSVRPGSQLLARPARGPILESILQRPGSEPCPLCSLIFSTAAEVDQHLRNHSMVCSGCDHLFASRVALFEHRMTCVPARPAPLPPPPPTAGPRSRAALCCSLCSATAPDTAGLNEHAAQAHGLLYRCPKCDCRTAELLQYAHHVRSTHTMDVPHPCNLCQTSFLRSEQREMHVRERHGPPLQPLSDRPLVKDRTIDGVRLPSLVGEKRKAASPPPSPSPPPQPPQGGQEAQAADVTDEEEHAASGMLIVKEETDLLL